MRVLSLENNKRLTAQRLLSGLGYLLVFALAIIFGADLAVSNAAAGKVFNESGVVKPHKVALVLGCLPGSYSFNNRINAAARLYHAGKTEYLLVSGDNSRVGYDEPTEMLIALSRRGVPAEKVIRDYAGFRTLDSIIRAKKVFQLDELILISQRYHLERALFIAQQKGISATGYYNDNYQSQYMWLRERLARVKAVFDMAFNTEPKFLGKKITICRNDSGKK